MLHLLEAHGVRIYSLTAENNELDACSLYWHLQPFIFLSTAKSGERGRFDAAHELGHLVLHGEYQTLNRPVAEVEANRFATAFLMPQASVLAQGLRDATPARILQAKRTWKVAAMALTHRVQELGLLTEWGYRTACVQLSRLGYRRSEPKGIPRESSQLLAKVLRSARDEGDTSYDRGGRRYQRGRTAGPRLWPHPDRHRWRRLYRATDATSWPAPRAVGGSMRSPAMVNFRDTYRGQRPGSGHWSGREGHLSLRCHPHLASGCDSTRAHLATTAGHGMPSLTGFACSTE